MLSNKHIFTYICSELKIIIMMTLAYIFHGFGFIVMIRSIIFLLNPKKAMDKIYIQREEFARNSAAVLKSRDNKERIALAIINVAWIILGCFSYNSLLFILFLITLLFIGKKIKKDNLELNIPINASLAIVHIVIVSFSFMNSFIWRIGVFDIF